MDTTYGLKIGQVVRSKRGRDKGNVQIIVDILDDKYVLVVDGHERKLESPKKKNIKHLGIYNDVLEVITTRETGKYQYNDAYIRRILQPYEPN